MLEQRNAITARSAAVARAAALLLFVPLASEAQTEIYRCPQPDGTVAFQGQPCPETPPPPEPAEPQPDARAEAPGDDFFDFENPFDAPPEEPSRPPAEGEAPSEERERCEKQARDAIDAIDLEIRRDASREQREEYLPRLRELTRQLRACKAL